MEDTEFDVKKLMHAGGPAHSAAPLPARVEIVNGYSVIVSTESGMLDLTELLAIALSAGSARVLEQSQVGLSIEPQESVRLGDAVLVKEDIGGVLESGGLRYNPVTTGCGIKGFVEMDSGWEEISSTALLGIIEVGIASLITEAVAIKEAEGIPDFISDGHMGV